MSVNVTVRGVNFRYGAKGPDALRDIAFTTPSGSVTTILGPSGSGKSTLLALLAGTATPTSGDIMFDGASVLADAPRDRDVGLVLQRPYLFPYLSVADNVAFGLAARGVRRRDRRAVAATWLARVGLDGYGERRPEALSGGEQQRVALVRALAIAPKLLLLDEPLASMDPELRDDMQHVLRDLLDATGVTTYFVTHDLGEAMALGHRTLVIRDGAVVDDGASSEVFERPVSRRAAELVGISTFIDGQGESGTLLTATGRQFQIGDATGSGPLTLGIRTEHVRFVDGHGPNTVAGAVDASVYRGEYHDVLVATELGPIRVRSAVAMRPLQSCVLHFPPDKLVVLHAFANARPRVEPPSASRTQPASSEFGVVP